MKNVSLFFHFFVPVQVCLSSEYYFLLEEYVAAASQYSLQEKISLFPLLPVLAAVLDATLAAARAATFAAHAC